MRAQATSVFHENAIKIAVSVTLKPSSTFIFFTQNSKTDLGCRVIYIFAPPTIKSARGIIPKGNKRFFYTHTNTIYSLKKGA